MPLFSGEPECAFCSRLSPGLDRFISLSYFSGVHRDLIHQYKSGRLPGLRRFYASRIHEVLTAREIPDPWIVPVPPRKGKIRRTGWDQVALLTSVLKSAYGYRIADCLRRSDALQQKTMSLERRREHLGRCIGWKSAGAVLPVPPASLVLLDDVCTSGATLAACSAVLRERWTGDVTGLALCTVL